MRTVIVVDPYHLPWTQSEDTPLEGIQAQMFVIDWDERKIYRKRGNNVEDTADQKMGRGHMNDG